MIVTDDYLEFLQSKFHFSQAFGHEIEQGDINPLLFAHQRDIVQWAVRKGRAAIFASFGLGKSFMQLETLRLLHWKHSGRYLIIAPLGVRQEFKRDAAKLGMEPTFVRTNAEVLANPGAWLFLTNYESVRDGKLDINLFTGVSLDEASVLRSYGSDTYQTFLSIFGEIPYRFVATATPSPNRYKELIHYAGFLGVMDTGQALTRFFQRDSTKANNLTLFPHMESEFFAWLHSWSIFLQRPSDLGYSDEGYELPPLKVVYHEIPARSLSGVFERDGQGQLLRDAAMGLKDAAREKRDSIEDRVEKMMEIISEDPDAHYLLWHDLEAERHAIRAALPEVSEVFGSLDLDIREQRVIDFSDGKTQFLSTKPELSGSGCNFQRFCHKAIFLGIGYKFNDFIQSIHRIHRFLQAHPCEIHIIYTETEREVLKALQAKWQQHEEVTANMSEIIRENGLSTTGLEDKMKRSIGVTRRVEKGRLFEAVHNDCVDEVRRMDSNSVDLIHTSIPFGNHYEYSASYNDFGHNPDHEAFFAQMDFLTPELLRILQPGRVAAIHVKDRIRFGNVTGYGMPTVEPFHADCIYHYKKHGFVYMGMITVVTDVVRENNQTYRLGWTENCKDGTKMGVGSPEYVLLFRKLPSDTSTAYADVPVVKKKTEYTRAQWQIDAHAFWRSSGERFLTSEEMSGYGPDILAKLFTERSLQSVYSHQAHVEIGEALEGRHALPSSFMAIAPGSHDTDVWTDVNRMRTLNGNQSQKGLVNHVCPLQFDIVDRIITRYTNPGELVFDPFAGLGTVSYRAIKLGRRGKGVELNGEYFEDSLRYLRLAEIEAGAPTLFDFEETALQMTEEVAA
jgi:DNA modification methylase